MSLDDQLQQLEKTASASFKKIKYEGSIFVFLMFLSILGVGISDASEQISHWYWLAMVPVFFAACLFLEWQASVGSGISTQTIVLKQMQYWLGLLGGVLLTFFMREVGSFNNEATGLVLLLLFALSTFLAGVTMGWMFRLLGIFLGLCLILVVYMEHYIGLIICISVVMLILYHFIMYKRNNG